MSKKKKEGKMEQVLKTQITCHNCKYEWESSTKMEKVTCPNCGIKTNVDN